MLPAIGFPGSMSGVPPSHPPSALSRKPALTVCNSGLKLLAFFEALGLSRTLIHPSVTGWRIKRYRHNQRSKEVPCSKSSPQQELNMASNSAAKRDASPRLRFHGRSSPLNKPQAKTPRLCLEVSHKLAGSCPTPGNLG